MTIHFTKHAEEKFEILREMKFDVSREDVIDCLNNPDRIEEETSGLQIAHKDLGTKYALRVVFKYDSGGRKVITFYPTHRGRYEKKRA